MVQLRQLWNVASALLFRTPESTSTSTGVDALADDAERFPPGVELVDDEVVAVAFCAFAAFALASCNACVSMALIC